MHGDLSLEVWSRPGANPFERKDIAPPGPFDFTKRRAGGIGQGKLTVPVNYDRINELIKRTPGDPATDVRRLARVFAEGVTLPVYEFFLDVTSDEAVESDVTLSGSGVESLLGDGIVEAWDWDGQPQSESTFPDWVWGGKDVVGPVETSWAPHIFEVWNNGTSGSFQVGVSINGGAFEYASFDFDFSAFEAEQAIENLGNVDSVTVEGSGTLENPWRIAIQAPTGEYTVAIGTISLGAGEVARVSLVQFGSITPIGWTQSLVGSTSIPHGVLTDFRATFGGGADPVLPADCPAAIVFLGQEFYFPGVQKRVRVTPGAPFQIGPVYLYAQGAGAELRVVVRDMNENLIGFEEITLVADTWTQINGFSIQIPEGITEVVYRIGHIGSGTPPRIFIACPTMTEGLPATTIGDIALQLFDDATENHVADGRLVWEDSANMGTTYLVPTWTTATDSNGVTWDNDEVSFTAKRGQTYAQVWANFVTRGYRWSITPSNTSGQWLLNLYNPNYVKVDATALQSPAINVGSGVTSGPIFRSHLSGNAVTVEGYQGFFGRSKSDLSIAAIGRREVYRPDRATLTTADAAIRAAEEVTVRLNSGLSVSVNIEPADPPIPLADWDVDWLVNVQVPPAVSKSAHQVAAITATVGPDKTSYKASFSSESFTGEVGVAEGVRFLLEKYEGFEREPPDSPDTAIGGAGGPATIFIAAANATPYSLAKADLFCTGSNDDAVFQQAADFLDAFYAGTIGNGLIVASEGAFSFSGTVDLPEGCSVRGLGAGPNTAIFTETTPLPGGFFTVSREQEVAHLAIDMQEATSKGIVIRDDKNGEDLRFFDLEINGGASAIYSEHYLLRFVIDRCHLNTAATSTTPVIRMLAARAGRIVNNFIAPLGTNYGIGIGAGSASSSNGTILLVIANNDIEGTTNSRGILITRNSGGGVPTQMAITGNVIRNCQGGWAMALEDVTRCAIVGNTLAVNLGGIQATFNTLTQATFHNVLIAANTLTGINSASATPMVQIIGGMSHAVIDNTINDMRDEGVWFEDVEDGRILGNSLRVHNSATTNTHDAIFIDGDANLNVVKDNVVRPSLDGTKTWRYGWVVNDAACDDNWITDNDLRTGYTTGASLDNGTGTVTTSTGDLT